MALYYLIDSHIKNVSIESSTYLHTTLSLVQYKILEEFSSTPVPLSTLALVEFIIKTLVNQADGMCVKMYTKS